MSNPLGVNPDYIELEDEFATVDDLMAKVYELVREGYGVQIHEGKVYRSRDPKTLT